MKLWIAIVAFLATKTVWNVNASNYVFDNLRKYYVECPTNDMLSTDNDTDKSMKINIKQTIDKDNNPLMISATVTNSDTNEQLLDGGPFNICEKQTPGSWDDFAVAVFNRAMIPKKARRARCPVATGTTEMPNEYQHFGASLDDKLEMGNYDISFTAQTSDQQTVFSALKFSCALTQPPDN